MIPKATLKSKAVSLRGHGSPVGMGRGFGSGAGKPSKYDPKLCKKVFRLRLLALSEADIALTLGVYQSTVQYWVRKHPEFAEAWDRGGNLADAHVARSLYRRANGWSHQSTKIINDKGRIVKVPYTERYPPDVGAIELWLTNRQREQWKKRSSQELTGTDGTPLIPLPPPILVLDFSGEDGPLIDGTDVVEQD